MLPHLILALNEFTAEQGGTIDPRQVIDDLGDILAQWIAALDDPQYRNYTATVAGEILKRRVRRYRETGNFPAQISRRRSTDATQPAKIIAKK